ncbi:MAG TPA: hypothetical protein VIU15_16295 [Streptomyces sp.]
MPTQQRTGPFLCEPSDVTVARFKIYFPKYVAEKISAEHLDAASFIKVKKIADQHPGGKFKSRSPT